jgi:hypothetical protein
MFANKNNDLNVKKRIIEYIFSAVDVSKYKYTILRVESDLEAFKSDQYYISLNFNGKNCFLVLVKLGNEFYSIIVDRKQLSYSLEKINYDNVDIFHCNANVDIGAYNGTIFDGILTKRDNMNQYTITDIYYFKGSDYSEISLDMKLYELDKYLKNGDINYPNKREYRNKRMEIDLCVNKIYDLSQTREIIEKTIPSSPDRLIRGVCFFPKKSGTRLLYIFNENQNNMQQPNNRYTEQKKFNNRKKVNKFKYMAKSNDPIYAILEMKATNTPDVYKLYAVEKINNRNDNNNNSEKLKKYKMDIACIQDRAKSKWCFDITSNTVDRKVFVKCIWRDDKEKWEPIEHIKNIKLPTLINDIKINFIELELSDSGSESD